MRKGARRTTFLTALWIGIAACVGSVAAGLLDHADEAAIRSVIRHQIDAFKRDDGPAAFAFAAPRIKTIFGTPETFMEMVRSSYGPVYRSRHVVFRPLARIEGKLVQPVLVIGPSGVPVTALYLMQRQPDGSWRIDGVVLVAEPNRGA